MKLSASVPDALWRAACRKAGSDSPSLVIQEALKVFCPEAPSEEAVYQAGLKALGLTPE